MSHLREIAKQLDATFCMFEVIPDDAVHTARLRSLLIQAAEAGAFDRTTADVLRTPTITADEACNAVAEHIQVLDVRRLEQGEPFPFRDEIRKCMTAMIDRMTFRAWQPVIVQYLLHLADETEAAAKARAEAEAREKLPEGIGERLLATHQNAWAGLRNRARELELDDIDAVRDFLIEHGHHAGELNNMTPWQWADLLDKAVGGGDDTEPQRDGPAFPAKWYNEKTKGYLNPSTLRQAFHCDRITGYKGNGSRNHYFLHSVKAAWPEVAHQLIIG